MKHFVSNVYEELVSDFESALHASDYAKMLDVQLRLIKYHRATERIVRMDSRRKAATLVGQAGKCLQSAELLVQASCSNFSGTFPKDKLDTSALVTALSHLKRCVDSMGSNGGEEIETMGQAAAAGEGDNRQRWVVVGGFLEGIIVLESADIASQIRPGKLANRSVVAEIERKGNRVSYALLEGDGPSTGWVSIEVSGNVLFCEAESVWEVCARRGAAVQMGKDRNTKAKGRLGYQTLVRKISNSAGRLNFKTLKAQGDCPPEGWADLQCQGQDSFCQFFKPDASTCSLVAQLS